MEKAQALTINLAKNRGNSFWDSFISWALTIGRVVVICTEGIALVAFLYRFSLDQELVNLHDHISQQTAVVNLLKNNEATFRNLQSRILLAKNVIAESNNFTKIFNDLLASVPDDMEVTTFQMTSDTLRIEGTIDSITSLRTLVDKLKSYPLVTSVSLDKIQTNTETANVGVTLTILLKTSATSITESGSSSHQSQNQ
jgi:Tfp pilus assembly protein PilN